MYKNYLTTQYLFSTQAPSNQKLFLVVVGIFVLFIIASILFSYNQTIHKGLKNRLFNFFLTIGILGLIFSFFRYESTPFVGTRAFIIALGLVAVVWYFVITVYSLTKMPKEIRVIKNHERYVQYLPKKKIKKGK